MENKVDDLDNQTSIPREGSGSLLASARKKQNKSVEEIAAELNLSITQIKTIELDQSEGLPEPTYVRGYIRSYARLLGLDAENADEVKGKGFFTAGKVIAMLFLLSLIAFLWFSGLLTNLLNSADESSSE